MSITVTVDPTNPGQFFACCGLLELADRLWPGGASGAFATDDQEFVIARTEGAGMEDARALLGALIGCAIKSTMTEEETARLKQLKNLKKSLRTPQTDAETQRLTEKWESERLCITTPTPLWLDWWADGAAGGSRFKTWAGKQIISDLVRALQQLLRGDGWADLPPSRWLSEPVDGGCLPLYFDAAIGAQSSSIDVGYSLDALDMRVQTKPLLELAAFLGLQRFRPSADRETETFTYTAWTDPLPPEIAAVVCSGAITQATPRRYTFRLLYRTKYLKSFLPAFPLTCEIVP